MRRGEQSAWTTAALTLALGAGSRPDLREAAVEVVRASGLPLDDGWSDETQRTMLAAQAAAPLLQTARIVAGAAWAEQSDEALLAQGRASGRAAGFFVHHALPHLSGLAEALRAPGAAMLDVGTGVGALAEGYATLLPELRVVGLDVMPRVLELAERRMAGSPVRDRVELRCQDVARLDERSVYDLAWLPAPFVPEQALRAGVTAVARALRPGGWLMVGHSKPSGEPLDEALDRLKTIAFGGTLLTGPDARQLLTEAGLQDAATMPTPPGAPGVTVARRAPDPSG